MATLQMRRIFVVLIVHNVPISINSTEESNQINEIQKPDWFMGYELSTLVDDAYFVILPQNSTK